MRCSPVGCDLMMGQHRLLLPAARAACVSTLAVLPDTSGEPFHDKMTLGAEKREKNRKITNLFKNRVEIKWCECFTHVTNDSYTKKRV